MSYTVDDKTGEYRPDFNLKPSETVTGSGDVLEQFWALEDELAQTELGVQDGKVFAVARKQGRTLLDSLYKQYGKNIMALRENTVNAYQRRGGLSNSERRELLQQACNAIADETIEYYRAQREVNDAVLTQHSGKGFKDYFDMDEFRADWQRALWQAVGGFSDTDYNGVTFWQMMQGDAMGGYATWDYLWGRKVAWLPDSEFLKLADDVMAHVQRSQMVMLCKHDPERPRFARIPQGGGCGFCVMLASRGYVYHSEQSAGAFSKYHAHCHCLVVPSFASWQAPGYDPEKYRVMWEQSKRKFKSDAPGYARQVFAQAESEGSAFGASSKAALSILRHDHNLA